MTATITTTNAADIADYLNDTVRPNGGKVTADGNTITIGDRALRLLADLDPNSDGHFDGQSLWIAGDDYTVTR